MTQLSELRELLFGDTPLRRWAGSGNGEPWRSFQEALNASDSGEKGVAERILRGVLVQRGLESRHYLQAWSGLRELGVYPEATEAQHLYGMVLDVPMAGGWDTLAAYEDHTCRYLNYTGGATIWEHPSNALDGPIDQLLQTGRATVVQIGPWEGSRPGLSPGKMRISFLCPIGLHFGEAPFEVLMNDPKAGAIINAGTALLQAVTNLTPSQTPG